MIFVSMGGLVLMNLADEAIGCERVERVQGNHDGSVLVVWDIHWINRAVW